jgi:uroporphyrinogen-III synthase
LDHYNSLYPDTDQYKYGVNKPSLLFLVGEVRRDIIPRTLMNPTIGGRRVSVEEVVVYETGVMEGFEGEFGGLMEVYNKELDKGEEGMVWVVVFSPTGCEAMLRVLEVGPFAGSGTGAGDKGLGAGGKVFVATIGPTTRDYLREKFGFEAHVCAARPNPEGVLEGIERFMGV